MKSLATILKSFNLSNIQIEILQQLIGKNWQTVYQLAKQTHIPRTTIYRNLEELKDKGIVEEKIDFKTSYYQAAPLSNFKNVIQEKENEVAYLRHLLPDLEKYFAAFALVDSKETQVHFYRGVRGIKIMEWKMCQQSDSTTYVFGNSQWHHIVGREFAEKVRQERKRQNIQIKEILNEKTFTPIAPDGSVTWTTLKEFIKTNYRHRQISKRILDITNEIIILPNKIHLFSFQDNELVGIEIVSPSYARFFRQLFKIIWNQAQIVDSFGGTDYN